MSSFEFVVGWPGLLFHSLFDRYPSPFMQRISFKSPLNIVWAEGRMMRVIESHFGKGKSEKNHENILKRNFLLASLSGP